MYRVCVRTDYFQKVFRRTILFIFFRLQMNEIRRSVKSRPDLRAVFDEKYRKIVSNLKWMERDHEEIVKAVGII